MIAFPSGFSQPFRVSLHNVNVYGRFRSGFSTRGKLKMPTHPLVVIACACMFRMLRTGAFLLLCLLVSGGATAQSDSTVFDAPGSYTYTVPAGVTAITVECWGGGGGGETTPNNQQGDGGGGGAYARKTFPVSSGLSYSIEVGVGGLAEVDGGASLFFDVNNTIVFADGGKAGNNNSAGSGGSLSLSIGDLIHQGGNGASGATNSGGGGGGAGSTGPGKDASNATAGGPTNNFGGAGGAGLTNANAGNNGNDFGGGGGGAFGSNTGGSGAGGRVCVRVNKVTFDTSLALPICPGETVTLTAISNFLGDTTFLWSNSLTSNSISVSPTTTTTYTVTVTQTQGGSTFSITNSIVVQVHPAVVANAGTDQCIPVNTPFNPYSFTLTGDSANHPYCSVYWTLLTGSVSLPNNMALNEITVSGLAQNSCASFQFTKTDTSTGCKGKDTVRVCSQPIAVAGTDQCLGTTTATLTGNTLPTATWAWQRVSGLTLPIDTSGTTGGFLIVRGLSQDSCAEYLYTLTQNLDVVCSGSDNVKLCRNPIINAGTDRSYCITTTPKPVGGDPEPSFFTKLWYIDTITFNTNNPSGTGTLLSLPNLSGNTGDIVTLTPPFNFATSGQAQDSLVIPLIWRVTNDFCPVSDTVNVTVYDTASVADITSNGGFFNYPQCGNDTFNLSAVSPAVGIGTWSFAYPSLAPAGVNITDITLASTTLTGLAPDDTVRVRWTVQNGNCPSRTKSQKLKHNPLPPLSITGNSAVCQSDSLTLTAVVDTAHPYDNSLTYAWDSNATTASIQFNTTSNGDTTFIRSVTVEDANGCTSTTSDAIYVVPKPVIKATSDIKVCKGETIPTINFAGDSLLNESYSWVSDIISNTGISSSGSGSIPTFVALNTDTLPRIDTVVVTPQNSYTLNSNTTVCEGAKDTFQIFVNPVPVRTNPFPTSICSGESLKDTIIPSYFDTVFYSWTTSQVTNIQGNQSRGVGAGRILNDTLKNTTNNTQILVPYTITLYDSIPGITKACTSATTFSVRVDPGPPPVNVSDIFGDPVTNSVTVCGGSRLLSFNLGDPDPSISYTWTTNTTGTAIAFDNQANSGISFPATGGSVTVTLTTENPASLGSCSSKQKEIVVNITPGDGFAEDSIVLKNPGNLLVYLDNSADRYRWGVDSIVRDNNGQVRYVYPPVFLPQQVYQFFAPAGEDAIFLMEDNEGNTILDTINYLYWVLVDKNGCQSRVYYNGPYASQARFVEPVPVAESITLSAYPNPGDGNLELLVSGRIFGNVVASLINTMGQTVSRSGFYKSEGAQTFRLDFSAMPAGLYQLVVVGGSDLEKASTKIMIHRR